MKLKLLFGLLLLFTSSGICQLGNSLYTDIKAHSIGEVVTVLIMENASARQESKDQSRTNAAVNADGTLSGSFVEFLPIFGASSKVSSDVDNSAGSTQEDRLTGKITATILEETDAGLLKIVGERTVEVNGEENIMKLEGLVRPRDIRTDNTVYSYNIAEAQIVYRKSGVVNAIASPATITKTVAITLLVALLGLAITGTTF
jgi:flagellar L-ring protein precursor FlgH